MPRILGLAICLLLVGGRDTNAQDCSGGTFLVAGAIVTGSVLYDIVTAPVSARRYNRKHLAIVPVLDPRRGSYGLSVSLSFGRSSRAASAVAAPVRKSPTTAFFLSFGLTAAPTLGGIAVGNDPGAGLFLGGVIVGPSVGHLYAGQFARGLGTIALRGLGTALAISSIVDCFD